LSQIPEAADGVRYLNSISQSKQYIKHMRIAKSTQCCTMLFDMSDYTNPRCGSDRNGTLSLFCTPPPEELPRILIISANREESYANMVQIAPETQVQQGVSRVHSGMATTKCEDISIVQQPQPSHICRYSENFPDTRGTLNLVCSKQELERGRQLMNRGYNCRSLTMPPADDSLTTFTHSPKPGSMSVRAPCSTDKMATAYWPLSNLSDSKQRNRITREQGHAQNPTSSGECGKAGRCTQIPVDSISHIKDTC
jgi:hypothetical protein